MYGFEPSWPTKKDDMRGQGWREEGRAKEALLHDDDDDDDDVDDDHHYDDYICWPGLERRREGKRSSPACLP